MSSTVGVTRGLVFEDLYRLQFAYSVAISPDGRWVAYTVMRPDQTVNHNRYDLWLISTGAAAAEDARLILEDEPQDAAPAWSPDGQTLAYLSRRDGFTQVCALDVASGDTRQITNGEYHAGHPDWSPDGKQIAFVASVPSLPAPWPATAYDDPADEPKVITRARYKFDGMGWFGQARSQVFVVDAATGGARPVQLTDEPAGIGQPIWVAERGGSVGFPTWSPDSTRLAYTTSVNEDEERDARCDVWTVDVTTGERLRITPNDGLYGLPAWSPDGTRLAVAGAPLPKKGGANVLLWTAPAQGGPLTLASRADICVGSMLLADGGTPSRAQPAWIGEQIYFSAGHQGTTQLFRVPAAGGVPEMVTAGDHALGSWSLDVTGTTLAFGASSPTNPGQVYLQTLGSTETPRQLTALNARFLADIALAEPEEFWTTSSDGSGTPVQGWIMRPLGFDPAVEHPLILQIHGGPHCAYGSSWYHEFQCFAAQGYVIAFCNPRGSAGYGEEFATSIYLDWGSKPMADVMGALDHVLAQGSIDTERLYVAGGSYGGYLVNWVVTHTDRFRAAVTGRCVSDLRTLALACDNGTLWMGEYFGGMPWEQPEVYAFGSPISHIANCRTPLFIEHQEQDMRCTADQAEQMYNALTYLGVETELVFYPNESHGMSRGGQPRHRVDRLKRMGDWFQRHA